MDLADAGPPHKRRKLSSHISGHATTADESALRKSVSTSITRSYSKLRSLTTQSRPRYIEEAHVHVHRRLVVPYNKNKNKETKNNNNLFGLFHRQDTLSTSMATSSVVTALPSATTNSSSSTVLTSSSSLATITVSDSSTDSSSSSSTQNSTQTPSSPSSIAPSSSIGSLSLKSLSSSLSSNTSSIPITSTSFSTSSSNSTIASITSTSTSSPTSSSLGPAFLFTTTLPDGKIDTLTRSRNLFTTTIDGQAVVIPSISGSLPPTSSPPTTSSATISSPTSTSTSLQVSTTVVIQTNNGVASTFTSIISVGATAKFIASSSGATSTTSSGSGGTTALASSEDGSNNSGNSPAPPGTIAGGVVGGAAGLAVVVLIAMLFIRWYRRKSQVGHMALPPGSTVSPDMDDSYRSRGPGMAERAGLMPFASAMPNFLRHQNRSVDDSEPSERGFTRVSGRKLPSAFSEGMSSGPASMPLQSEASHNSSGSPSFYRDNVNPFYGGPGDDWRSTSPTLSSARNEDHELMTMSPGPQRTPTIRHATRDYYRHPRRPSDGRLGTSPPVPGSLTRLERSETPSTIDPTRNSRFTEEM